MEESKRTLLLCFIHGFKGTDNTFKDFPGDLERQVSKQLPEHHVQSVVYPKYDTKGELEQATAGFVEWLKERVIDVRKERLEKPWPPADRKVGVILVAHSMGGFVAADALFLTLKDRPTESETLFPLIQGILTFDTPYNGLARSMFVYGAFSNYSKVSNVFNAMTALSAAAPASLARLSRSRNATAATAASASSFSGSSTAWQLIAVRTGTVGAIAAGGVAAYVHREAIMKGVKNMRNLKKEDVVDGYNQSIESLGQGLAYINRGNVGRSFAWLSDHFTFVGSLLKPKELSQRLDRLAALEGVGVHDFYVSMGENGYWSGGYFVPERMFCAVPEGDHPAARLFERIVLRDAEDEIGAHVSMFRPQKNRGYENMTDRAAELVKEWFLSEKPIVDAGYPEDETDKSEDKAVDEAIKKAEHADADAEDKAKEVAEKDDGGMPDESPIDIANAAALVPLPGGGDNLTADPEADTDEKRTYMQHLFQVAEQAGSGVRGWMPTKVPEMPSIGMPAAVSNLGKGVQMPSIWGKKGDKAAEEANKTADAQEATKEGGESTKAEPTQATGEAEGSKEKGEADVEMTEAERKPEAGS